MYLPRRIHGVSRTRLVVIGVFSLVTLAIIISRPGVLIGIVFLTVAVLWLRVMQRTRTQTRPKLIGAITLAIVGTLTGLSALAAQPNVDSTHSSASVTQSFAVSAPSGADTAHTAQSAPHNAPGPHSTVRDEYSARPTGKGTPPAVASAATWKELPNVTATRQLLDSLSAKGPAPKTGYSRAVFGQRWADVDRNGCDTRNDILARDLTDIRVKPGTRHCVVVSGKLSDPYTGQEIIFQKRRNSAKRVQIDHVVALSDAWQKGAQRLDEKRRVEFANDPMNLLAVDGPSNQQKGDGDAATWLPENKAFRCTYISLQIHVKAKHGLWITHAEKDAMIRILNTCTPATSLTAAPTQEAAPPATSEPSSKSASQKSSDPHVHGLVSHPQPAHDSDEPSPVQPAPAPEPPAALSYEEPVVEQSSFEYENCCAVWQAIGRSIWVGEPGFHSKLDRNNDGEGCEKRPKNCP